MKINRRLTIKGQVDFERGTITVFDKDEGETDYTLREIFEEFDGLDEVTLNLAHDIKK